MSGYAELQVTSGFSFLRGASLPDELALTAAALGHGAIGLADRNSLGGVVRLHAAAKRAGIRALVGCRIDLVDGPSVLVYPTDRAAYGRLCRLLTGGYAGMARAGVWRYADLLSHSGGQVVILLPPEGRINRHRLTAFTAEAARVAGDFHGYAYMAIQQLHGPDDQQRFEQFVGIADAVGLPVVATNDVHYHSIHRAPLQDVLTCIRGKTTLAAAGRRLFPNNERTLKSAQAMRALFHRLPDAVARSLEIVDRCRFSLDELRAEHPLDGVPDGLSPQEELVRRTWVGAGRRWPGGVPAAITALLERELALIEQLGHAAYFLAVDSIVQFARDRGILCQGRGSAANSAVCYALEITAVDPEKHDLLFERFVSTARDEPPDIDVDFEHERREEVIQYIYRTYGRARAGLTAVTITYRTALAVREVGRVLGLSADTVAALSQALRSWGAKDDATDEHLRAAGLDPADRTIAQVVALVHDLVGFPRHRSQHPGGFVLVRDRLDEVVPVVPAAMAERTVIEWDKDDLDTLKILKVDVLGLGILSCLRKGFDMLSVQLGRPVDLSHVPAEDAQTYAMMQRADTVGVFQIESRAQMAMLPRLKPETFYDLVIEVAIVRPGPIQGGMVHPYLRRRQGLEPVQYPSEEMRQVLKRTLGVPLFQEQAMKIAIVGAGFSAADADRLRRAMGAFRRDGEVRAFRDRFLTGMATRGYDQAFAERCFEQIEGFGQYGFPESHAASFALLVYASAWLKRHHPAVFTAALLNSQPMGFYAPAQIVRDARDHGVEVRAVDVNQSDWDCTLEVGRQGLALRLGLRLVRGFREIDAIRLVEARGDGYGTVEEVWSRSGLGPPALERLADADAWRSLGLERRNALWRIKALAAAPLPLFAEADARALPGDNRPPVDHADEPDVVLPALTPGEAVVADYRALGLSLHAHPVAFLRPSLRDLGYTATRGLEPLANGTRVGIAGLVLTRQRPGAGRVVFITVEDEAGCANVVVWSSVFERYRRAVVGARLLGIWGRVQADSGVVHVIADHLADLSDLTNQIANAGLDQEPEFPASRDFR